MSFGVEYRQARRESQLFERAAYAVVGTVALCLVAIAGLGVTILDAQGGKSGSPQSVAAASQAGSAIRPTAGKR